MVKKPKEKYRDVRKKHYTQIHNDMINDEKLTLEGKGLMNVFLSNDPEKWEINMKNIISRSLNGRDAHYRVVNELIEKGYFARITMMDAETKQFEDMEYIFSDVKRDILDELEKMQQWANENKLILKIEYQTKKEKKKRTKPPLTGNQEMAIPLTESQDTETPDAAGQYNNNSKDKNINLNNTNFKSINNKENFSPTIIDGKNVFDLAKDILKGKIK